MRTAVNPRSTARETKREPARPRTRRRTVVLLSGGLDSSTCLAWALDRGDDVIALSFDYGQRHDVELRAARHQAKAPGVIQHLVVRVDSKLFRGSSLVGRTLAVRKSGLGANPESEIPATYVPARNLLFLSHAIALAESSGAERIVIGANALDYSGYPDCRPEFLRAFERTANLGTKAGAMGGRRFRIEAPLIQKSKAEIVELAVRLNVDLSKTSSCYDPAPSGTPCRRCDSCRLRAKGFLEAKAKDPLLS